MYYSNGNIKYKGIYKKGEQDGIGHYIYKNGEYYIGQWQHDLRQGKGTLYFYSGKIKCEGEWNNDVFNGN